VEELPMKTTDFCPVRHYENKEFLFTAEGEKTIVESVALIIRGRRGRARIVKARGKNLFAVYTHDGGRPAARVAIEKFREQYATPEAG
jgi:hypothetical protein